MKNYFSILLLCLAIQINTNAQHFVENVSNKAYYHLLDRYDVLHGFDSSYHVNIKGSNWQALMRQKINNGAALSNQDKFNWDTYKDNFGSVTGSDVKSKKPILKEFYQSPNVAYLYDKDDVFISLNPVFNVKAGREIIRDAAGETSQANLITNSRGIELRALIDNKITLYSYITDNAYNTPQYIDEMIMAEGSGIFPGETWVKAVKAGELTLEQVGQLGTNEFFSARGYIGFAISNHISAQFGHDKNMLGNGYRSMLISDNASPYLFLKLNTNFHRFNYQNLFYEVNNWPDLNAANMVLKKYGAYHHISVNLGKRLNVSLFENVVFSRGDTSTANHLEWQYLNPIIFYKAIEHNMGGPRGSEDNHYLGLDVKYNFGKHFQVYGQFLLDDISFQTIKPDVDSMLVKYGVKGERAYETFGLWSNKWGVQLGAKYYDAFGVENLDFQIEHNRARPFTYSHYSTFNRYTHAGQALAHPLGANFSELLLIGRYQPFKRWSLNGFIMSSKRGLDTDNSNYGSDLNKSSNFPGANYEEQIDGTLYNTEDRFNSTIGKGVLNQLFLVSGTLSFQWKPNLFFDGSFTVRNQTVVETSESKLNGFVMFGIRLNAFDVEHKF